MMKQSGPLVSVVMPVFNGERYMAEAIESVLAQTYRPTELIVVDDGSADGSAAIARSYKEVSYIYQDNQGPAAARNRGLAAARGEFVALIDQDDVWLPGKLEVQVRYLREHPEVGFVVCRIESFLDPGLELTPGLEEAPLIREQISLNTMLVRREVFESVGGFDPSYRLADDLDWVARSKDLGIRMTILGEVLMRRRIHRSNLSLDSRSRKEDWFQLFKASIDRQRGGGSWQ